MRRFSLPAALVLVALTPCGVLAQDEAPAEEQSLHDQALEVIGDYLEKFKAKDAVGAMKAHWSFESLCAGIFADDWGPLSDADKQACAKGLEDMLVPAMSDPQMTEMMAAGTFSEPEAEEPKDGVVQVTFTWAFEAQGVPPTPQFFWITLVDGEPKIVDMARQDPAQALTKAVGGQWRGVKKQQPELTPMDYIRMMAGG
jgi:hypothetical protein